MIAGTLDGVPELQRFDLISLSNIMDWMPLAEITSLIGYLQNEMKSGATVLYRQLNNYTDLSTYFGDSFAFNEALGYSVPRNRTQLILCQRSCRKKEVSTNEQEY